MTIGPVLKYPGAKWRMAKWIVGHMPKHTTYVEPFFGSGAIFFRKEPSRVETINDINGRVVNLFRVIRDQTDALCDAIGMTPWAREEYEMSYEAVDDPVEDARRFLVRCWQAHGSRLHGKTGWRIDNKAGGDVLITGRWARLPERIRLTAARLGTAQIDCRPALEVIANHRIKQVLIYADPPYVPSTRSGGKMYADEMTYADHEAILDALSLHPGPVLLSGYDSDLYRARLGDWYRVTRTAGIEHGQSRTEVLWLNPVATAALESRQLVLTA